MATASNLRTTEYTITFPLRSYEQQSKDAGENVCAGHAQITVTEWVGKPIPGDPIESDVVIAYAPVMRLSEFKQFLKECLDLAETMK
jgi:hypothetical protein